MKYLDIPILTYLSTHLSDLPTPEYKVNVRFEAYSVKPIGKERKMYKEMEEAYVSEQEGLEELSFSPEMREAGLSSCFGRLDEKESRKVHFLLVSTLNAAFPDHDFSALRPDQFTREPSKPEVLANVSAIFGSNTNIASPFALGQMTMSPPSIGINTPHHPAVSTSLSSSPSGIPPNVTNPDLYRLFQEAIPEDSEVYSWFPQPEYDPHMEAEDGEVSEDNFDEEEEFLEDAAMSDSMDLDGEIPADWGQAGMELDDIPPSAPAMARQRSMSGKQKRHSVGGTGDTSIDLGSHDGYERKNAGLLWSQNYFFYSKRQKRVLLLSCWCRKRPSQLPSPPVDDSSAFPLAISSSFTQSSNTAASAPAPIRSIRRERFQNRTNGRLSHRKSKPQLKLPIQKGDLSSTIPIRGMEPATPRPQRLATSAPSSFTTPSPQAALAKMNARGFKPRQTPARILLNAAAASNSREPTDLANIGNAGQGVGDRVRKDRSESTTPGPTPSMSLIEKVHAANTSGGPSVSKAKRNKV